MARVTYFVVVPFIRDEFGDLVSEDAIEKHGRAEAMALALALSKTKTGVIAFSRSGDPATGDFDDAVELGRFGEVPADLE